MTSKKSISKASEKASAEKLGKETVKKDMKENESGVAVEPKTDAPVANVDGFQSPKGMHDIVGNNWVMWDKVESVAKDVAGFYNFDRIETPILEDVNLFIRGVGESTDIVEKEMFVVKTKGGDQLALRPEMTAPVMRSYLQHGMHRLPQPSRLFYIGPMFRHEKPQAGRYRELHQFGAEILGGDGDAIYDAQMILMLYRFLEAMKVKNVIININSIGCKTCRKVYRKKLIDHFKGEKICKDCANRIAANPLRVLDCKEKQCQEIALSAPNLVDTICAPCKDHFKEVLEYLDEVKLPYVLNNRLVRGLDYYNRTVFEMCIEGTTLALAGGGRYDYLAEMLGGKPIAGVGGAVGIERVIEHLKSIDAPKEPKEKAKVFLVHVGAVTKRKSLSIIETLREHNIGVAEALGKDSLSAQMERAAKIGAPIALIFGQREAFEESIIVRDMATGTQESVPLTRMVDELKKQLHKNK